MPMKPPSLTCDAAGEGALRDAHSRAVTASMRLGQSTDRGGGALDRAGDCLLGGRLLARGRSPNQERGRAPQPALHFVFASDSRPLYAFSVATTKALIL